MAKTHKENPFQSFVGINLEKVNEKGSLLTLTLKAKHFNLYGIPHGGIHSTLLDISMGIAVAIGLYIKNFKFKEIIFSGLISSLSFYVITNFGAWLTLEMYAKDFSGLLQSYIMAIPFFHNTLFSTIFYASIFHVSYKYLNYSFIAKKI